MKKLFPTFAESSGYRGLTQNTHKLSGKEFNELKTSVLKRDHHTCAYCNFHAEEWQTINFLDGNSTNNKLSNLITACPMCNLILNTPVGCQQEGIVELYSKSDFTQNQIVQITRKMRSQGKSDERIVQALGLKEKVPFKMNKNYLKGLFAFITSWKGSWGQWEEALQYSYKLNI